MTMRSAPRALAVLASIAFIALGLPDGLLGVAWPSMRQTFALSLDDIGALLAAFAAGYVASSFMGGRAQASLGLGWLLVLSCLATAVCLLGYGTAGHWWLVVALAALGGVGAGGIDTGINTYAALNHGPRMLNWLHACFGIGAASGPLLMTAVLAAGSPWQRGYLMAGAAQLVLAGVFLVTLRRWPAVRGTAEASARAPLLGTLRRPVVLCSVLVFLAYTGVETAIGAWTFTLLTESRGVPAMTAGPMASLFWTGLTAGRVLGAVLGHRLAPEQLVALCLACVCLGTGLLAAGLTAATDAAGLLVAGIAAGPVFPTLISMTPGRVGVASAGTVVGFQIAAAATGQALLPAMLGAVGDRLGIGALGIGLVVMATLPLLLHEVLARLSVSHTAATPLS
jgi:fucose permease